MCGLQVHTRRPSYTYAYAHAYAGTHEAALIGDWANPRHAVNARHAVKPGAVDIAFGDPELTRTDVPWYELHLLDDEMPHEMPPSRTPSRGKTPSSREP